MKKSGKFLMVAIASALMIFFFAVPIVKVKEIDMAIVIVIGLAAMIWNFVETMREKDD